MAVHFIDTSKISDSCRDSIKRHISYVNKIPVQMTKNERFVLARVIGVGGVGDPMDLGRDFVGHLDDQTARAWAIGVLLSLERKGIIKKSSVLSGRAASDIWVLSGMSEDLFL